MSFHVRHRTGTPAAGSHSLPASPHSPHALFYSSDAASHSSTASPHSSTASPHSSTASPHSSAASSDSSAASSVSESGGLLHALNSLAPLVETHRLKRMWAELKQMYCHARANDGTYETFPEWVLHRIDSTDVIQSLMDAAHGKNARVLSVISIGLVMHFNMPEGLINLFLGPISQNKRRALQRFKDSHPSVTFDSLFRTLCQRQTPRTSWMNGEFNFEFSQSEIDACTKLRFPEEGSDLLSDDQESNGSNAETTSNDNLGHDDNQTDEDNSSIRQGSDEISHQDILDDNEHNSGIFHDTIYVASSNDDLSSVLESMSHNEVEAESEDENEEDGDEDVAESEDEFEGFDGPHDYDISPGPTSATINAATDNVTASASVASSSASTPSAQSIVSDDTTSSGTLQCVQDHGIQPVQTAPRQTSEHSGSDPLMESAVPSLLNHAGPHNQPLPRRKMSRPLIHFTQVSAMLDELEEYRDRLQQEIKEKEIAWKAEYQKLSSADLSTGLNDAAGSSSKMGALEREHKELKKELGRVGVEWQTLSVDCEDVHVKVERLEKRLRSGWKRVRTD